MARNRIDYGIDLGTTNSAIARMEQGEPVIKKSDLQHDTIPSCVGWNRKGVLMVGETALNQLKSDRLRAQKSSHVEQNVFIEFKRTMGTDKRYAPAALDKDFSSEELSAEVLKKLKSFVQDENVHAAVITVPAKFSSNQRDATARAAKLAGFDMFELLQEPIAACMAYGLGVENKEGTWVVFDFGGGTFDVALVRSEEGILKVLDTEGDNHLGGKNLDYAIVDELILPYLQETYELDDVVDDDQKRGMLRDAMKRYAEEAKIQLSYKGDYHVLTELGEIPLEDAQGEEVELDLPLTSAQLEAAVAPIFQRAIDITKGLLERNHLKGSDVTSLILVGGPTHSPILRRMLEEQIAKPDTRIDPMTAVAVGAALYASTIKVSEEVREATRDVSKVQLDLGYEATSVQPMEFVSVKLHLNGQAAPEGLMVEFERADGTWASGRKPLDSKGDVVEVELNEGRVNAFAVKVYDAAGNHVACEPDQFTAIQGTQVSAATLPSNMGIEIYRREDDRRIFLTIRGLEMNQSLPATGTMNGLRTSQDLRPGNGGDVVRIPIYEGGHDAPGSLAILNEHIYDARITGNDVPSLVPSGSTVDVTIQTDRGSGRPVLMKVYFPHLDEEVEIEVASHTVQQEVDAGWLQGELEQCGQQLDELEEQEGADEAAIGKARKELVRLQQRFEQDPNDYDAKKEVVENLKKLMREVDRMRAGQDWPSLQADLDAAYADLVKANGDLGNEQTTLLVEHLKDRMDKVVAEKSVRLGRALLEEMRHLFFKLTEIYQLINVIRYSSESFNSIRWSDRGRALQLVDEGRSVVAAGPTVERLTPIVRQLWDLMPDDERPADTGGLLTD